MIHYRKKKFPYKQHEREIYHIAEKGDFALFSGEGLVFEGIRAAQDSMWGHAALYVGHHKIVEAIQSGVKQKPIKKYFDNKTIFMIRRANSITVDQVSKMMKKIYVGPDKLIGEPYDFMQIFGALTGILLRGWGGRNVFDDPNRKICSEVVDESFEAAGIDIVPHLKQVRDAYPKDLAFSSAASTILYLNPRSGILITDPAELAELDKYAMENGGDWAV